MPNQANDSRGVPNLEGPPAGLFFGGPAERTEARRCDRSGQGCFASLRTSLDSPALARLCLAEDGRANFPANAERVPRACGGFSHGGSRQQGRLAEGRLGGIAELAGIDLGGGGGRKVEAFATLMPPGLFANSSPSNNLMPILYSERWDARRSTGGRGKKPPTMEQGVKRFNDSRNHIGELPRAA